MLASGMAPPSVDPTLNGLLVRPARYQRRIRRLVEQMGAANPLWAAPRIHGELTKLVIDVSGRTVSRLLRRRRRPVLVVVSHHRRRIVHLRESGSPPFDLRAVLLPVYRGSRIARTIVGPSRPIQLHESSHRATVVIEQPAEERTATNPRDAVDLGCAINKRIGEAIYRYHVS